MLHEERTMSDRDERSVSDCRIGEPVVATYNDDGGAYGGGDNEGGRRAAMKSPKRPLIHVSCVQRVYHLQAVIHVMDLEEHIKDAKTQA